MRINLIVLLTLSSFIVLFSGCGRIVDWAKESFYQGTELHNYSKVPSRFLRSVSVYDQFETVGAFDALWLSIPVRTSYAQLHACRHGMSLEHEKAFLRRQLEENNHYIDFYILSPYSKPLDAEDSLWSLFLEVNGCRYAPRDKIKAVDLVREYKFFFGKKFNKFKVPYLARFVAVDHENNPLIDDDTKVIRLIFRGVEKEVILEWDLGALPQTTKLEESCSCGK